MSDKLTNQQIINALLNIASEQSGETAAWCTSAANRLQEMTEQGPLERLKTRMTNVEKRVADQQTQATVHTKDAHAKYTHTMTVLNDVIQTLIEEGVIRQSFSQWQGRCAFNRRRVNKQRNGGGRHSFEPVAEAPEGEQQ